MSLFAAPRLLLYLAVCASAVVGTTPYAPKQPLLSTQWTSQIGTNPWPQYPRPQLVREAWQTLNGVWQFQKASSAADLSKPPVGQDLQESILVPSCIESGPSGVMESNVTYSWFRRTFDIPKEWGKSRVLLQFGAVDYEASVFINGKNATFHRGGYDGFSVDVTSLLREGQQNELLVFVYDPTDLPGTRIPLGKQTRRPQGVFYTACTGIWQTVWLEPVRDNYVSSIDTFPGSDGTVNMTVRAPSATKVNIAVLDQDGKSPIAQAAGKANEPIQLRANGVKPWSFDSPTLYNIRVQIDGGDVVTTYTGFRTVSSTVIDGVRRPTVNGKYNFQFGTLDQGFWPDGIYTPPTYEAMRSDLDLLKKLGFNAIRKHIKYEPALFYRACDELGLLVWQDMPSLSPGVPSNLPPPTEGQYQEFARQMRQLVSQHVSFPSIVTWVIYNEGWGQLDSREFELTQMVRNIDSSRLIDSVSGWYYHGAGDVSDNHHYTSPQCGFLNASAPASPANISQILAQGEFGGIGEFPGADHYWNVSKARGTSDDGTNNGRPNVYALEPDVPSWNKAILGLFGQLKEQARANCSVGIYTQTSDVEAEVNGLRTYDRAIDRPDVKAWQAAIAGVYGAGSASASRTNPKPRQVDVSSKQRPGVRAKQQKSPGSGPAPQRSRRGSKDRHRKFPQPHGPAAVKNAP